MAPQYIGLKRYLELSVCYWQILNNKPLIKSAILWVYKLCDISNLFYFSLSCHISDTSILPILC